MRNMLLTLALLGVATGAWATPENLEGGVFVAHAVDALAYTTTPPTGGWCVAYGAHAINDLSQVDVTLAWNAVGNTWYILAAWELESKTWCGTEFGFGGYDASLYAVLEYAACYPVAGLEIPTPGWPGPNEGTAFVTTGTPWSGNWVPVYWFGGYSYDASYGSTVIPIAVDPPTGFCGFSNCMNPPASFTVGGDFRGGMGVNMDGYVNPSGPPWHWPPQAEPWACCLPDPLGACVMLMEQDCLLAGGVWLGEGFTCEPVNPCPQPGACCIGGLCEVMMVENCDLLQGEFQGPGTTCEPNPCEAVCCIMGTEIHECQIMLENGCAAIGGYWHPEWTSCEPNPCQIFTPVEDTSWGQIKDMYR